MYSLLRDDPTTRRPDDPTTRRPVPAPRHLPAAVLLALALLAAACSPPPASAPSWGRPNILLLVLDCLRADRLDPAFEREASPRLDALAAESVRFSRAFSQANWTRPSIPSYLTGLYPTEHGLTELGQGAAAGRSEVLLSPEAVTLAERLSAAGYATAMIGEQHQLSPRFNVGQGFEHYNHKGSRAESIHFGFLDWLDSAPRPFFAYLHYLELHWPYCPPEETRDVFTPGWEGREFCFQWRQLRDDLRTGAVVLTPEEIEVMAARYDEELLALDARIGELFDALRERGVWDDTLVVVTSDHGEEFFEHGGMGHGSTLHDELTAVPLVFKPPAAWNGPQGADVDALVELRDLAPTLLEAARLDASGVEAHSLLPFLFGREPGVRREFVTSEDTRAVAVRTADLKLIVPRDGGPRALYDLREDPGETRDVAGDRPTEVARLEGYLRRWRGSLQPLDAPEVELDDETLEGLKALGYVD